MTVEISSREAPLSGISVEVLSKEIGILTSFGPIQPFLGTFVLSKETGLSGTMVINSIFSWELSYYSQTQLCRKLT